MPKVILQPMMVQIRGTMYDMVFKLSPTGKMIVTKRPDMSKVKWSPAQEAQRQRFRDAVACVKAALAEPEVRARYESRAREQHKRAWDLAMADHFKGRDLHSGE
jgi:hypothetical protein